MKFIKSILYNDISVKKETSNNKYSHYMNLSKNIQQNRSNLEKAFKDCDDIVYRRLYLYDQKKKVQVLLVFLKNLVDLKEINENIIKPLNYYGLNSRKDYSADKITLDLTEKIVNINNIYEIHDFKEIINEVLSGNTVLVMDGYSIGLALSTTGGEARAIEESPVENIIRGPRDSFVEKIDVNIGLIRRKIRSSSLKAKNLVIGSESQTVVSVVYMEGIVNKQALKTLMEKLGEIRVDGIFESGYIEQYLESSPYSPFPQMQITERPDKACGNLLEGRIIILVDGSPLVLILPVSFFHFFQSPEDYYERILYGNFIRFLRFVGVIIATSFPAIYVALVSFHHEMLPVNLITNLSRTRAQVPFPPVVEALLMEFTFEILREASARLPSTIAQTVGIVGAIVIGEAAIQANIASPAMIIVVAVTALGSYILPHYSTSYSLRIIRFFIVLMASIFGAFGIIIAWSWIIIHLCNLEILGYPFLSPLAPLSSGIIKDGLIRSSLLRLRKRPKTSNSSTKYRR